MNVISLRLLLVGGALPGLPGLPSAPGRFGPGIPADIFGFGDRKSTNTRMGPAKVPQPGVESYTWLPLCDPWLAPSKKKGRHQSLLNEEKQVNINVF